MLLFPNFQRSFRPFIAAPFFEWECKGKDHIISTKFFFDSLENYLESSGLKINLFCKELAPFLEADGKVREDAFTYQF